MYNENKEPLLYKICLGYCVVFLVVVLFNLKAFLDGLFENGNFIICILSASISTSIMYIFYVFRKDHFLDKLTKQEDDFQKKIKSLKLEHWKEQKNFEKALNEENIKNSKLSLSLSTKCPYIYSASLYSDLISSVYKNNEDYLKFKTHPARTAAETVSRLKNKTNEYICMYKEMLYKYETLLSIFPELEKYVDDINYIKEGDLVESLNELQQNYDRVRDWLTAEEYKKLSEAERNQRALDLFLKRKMTPKEIGDDYEMYIGWLLRNKGYSTEMFGLDRGLEDLGRDIIAFRYTDLFYSSKEILIVQCKRWSQKKEIHENVICQLYGTTIQYIISHKNEITDKVKVWPVLATTAPLSSTAQAFADYLGVKVRVIAMGEYPRIKCNVNNGNKIYHLPFDQQYKTSQIKFPGEFYAFTVKEAIDKGFRRAFRWHGN